MRKLLLFLMLHTVQLFAAPPATVTVASTYYNADGSTFSGSMRITSPPFKCAGANVAGVDKTYTVSNGVVSVPLVPNIGCVGTVGYTVKYTVGLVSTTRYWSIPETPSTTTVDAVESSVQPSLGMHISLANIPFGAVTPGQYLGRSLDGKSWVGYTAVGEPVISVGTINQYWRGDKTWQSFPAVPTNTSQLPELTNLYFTNARVLSAMSGLYVPPARTVAGKALSADISLVKADVGLGNVDNTSDANKPVSTAQQTALDLKASLSALNKTLVGLGNVDNTADANKPLSTPQQIALDLKANLVSPTFTGAFDASSSTTTKPIKTGTTLPASCGTGEVFFDTDAAAGNNVYTCLSNTWSVISSGEIATADAGLQKILSAFSVDETVVPIVTIGSGVPTGACVGVRIYLDSADSYKPYQCGAGTWRAGGSSYTLPTASGSVLGGIKTGSGLSIDGDGVVTASGGTSAGANRSQSFTSQTSVTVSGIGTPNVGLACYDGSGNAIAGSWSISGTAPNDITVSFATAQTGRCVVLGGASRYSQAISGSTSYTVTGATHALGSCDVQVQIWDNSSPAKRVEAGNITCDSTSKDIVVAFATTQAGRLVIQ